ncbi:PPK2 family polyphosphate kinase [Actimicrobium antarcticum]|uniref:Polyphosphate kinase-2-related domain-containing protein n=1 Tax=Actimicrobium antarcticum TaxID=1051899 RepID=A0ABP7T2X7_9BURK
MKFSTQFRPKKSFKVNDSDAGDKPLSSGDKAKDKLAVDALAQQIAELQNVFYAAHKRKLLLVLQGMDTSGKDGTVKDVLGRIDPLGIRSVAFKAPTTIEKEHDYLWRIHREMPAQGEIVIFNRSHYEDVLITRVHDWINDDEVQRRLAQIRDFERMLSETGTVVLKFFLHISKDQQKKRLEDRIADPDKHWKFDLQDIEERKSWDAYQSAYTTAINATDADHAPWFVIPADSKTHRNLVIASIVLEILEGMKLAYPPAKPELKDLKII